MSKQLTWFGGALLGWLAACTRRRETAPAQVLAAVVAAAAVVVFASSATSQVGSWHCSGWCSTAGDCSLVCCCRASCNELCGLTAHSCCLYLSRSPQSLTAESQSRAAVADMLMTRVAAQGTGRATARTLAAAAVVVGTAAAVAAVTVAAAVAAAAMAAVGATAGAAAEALVAGVAAVAAGATATSVGSLGTGPRPAQTSDACFECTGCGAEAPASAAHVRWCCVMQGRRGAQAPSVVLCFVAAGSLSGVLGATLLQPGPASCMWCSTTQAVAASRLRQQQQQQLRAAAVAGSAVLKCTAYIRFPGCMNLCLVYSMPAHLNKVLHGLVAAALQQLLTLFMD